MPLSSTDQYNLTNKLNRTVAYRASLGSLVVKASGKFTTVGGDATESIPLTGLATTDVCQVTLHTAGAVPVTILTSACAANAITVVLSADPSNDHVLQYTVFSPVA